MKKFIIKFLSILLIMSTLLVETTCFSANEEGDSGMPELRTEEQMSVEGQNSFGDLLAGKINTEYTENENSDYYVRSIEMSQTDTVAYVQYNIIEDCTLVVAIYDNSGKKLIATGRKSISSDENQTEVFIEGVIPEYYFVKAYLVETDTLAPLCSVYNNPNYTKEMQEFFDKTVDDFDSEKVLSLDESKDTNFAVYSDDVEIVEGTSQSNILLECDEANGRYVFGNVTEQMSMLSCNDIFSFSKEDGELLIIKVKDIQVSGNKVIVLSKETSLEEVFEYVKIEEFANNEMEVDTSTLGEEVTYNGIMNETASQYAINPVQEPDVDVDTQIMKHSFTIGKDGGTVKGSLDLALSLNLKIYINGEYSYVEFTFPYSMDVALTFKAKMTYHEIPLFKLTYTKALGSIKMVITPRIVVEASVQAKYCQSYGGEIGFRASLDEGIKWINEVKRDQNGVGEEYIEVKGTIFIGLVLEPEMQLIHAKICDLKLETKVGLKITVVNKYEQSITGVRHDCISCYDGSVVLEMSGSAKVIMFSKVYELSKGLTIKIPLRNFDFYLNFDAGFFYELGDCPNQSADTYIQIVNAQGQGLSNVKITGDITGVTDENGGIKGYFKVGDVNLEINVLGYMEYVKEIAIAAKRMSHVIVVPDDYILDENNEIDVMSFKGSRVSDYYKPGYEYTYRHTGKLKINSIPDVPGYSRVYMGCELMTKDGAGEMINILDPVEIGKEIEFWGQHYRKTNDSYEKMQICFGFYFTNNEDGKYDLANDVWIPVINITFRESDYGMSKDGNKWNAIDFSYIPALSWHSLESSVIQDGSISESTLKYTELVPNTLYNIYGLKDVDIYRPLSEDNLIYINQVKSDEYGRIEVEFLPKEDYKEVKMLVVGDTKNAINDAEVQVENLTYNGEEQKAICNIMYENEILREGIDYILSEDVFVNNIGEYELQVTGIGRFTGSVERCFYVNATYNDLQILISEIESNLSLEDSLYKGIRYTTASLIELYDNLKDAKEMSHDSTASEIMQMYSRLHYTCENDLVLADEYIDVIVPCGNASVEGTGWYAYGDDVILNVIAETGYLFDRWTESSDKDAGAISRTNTLKITVSETGENTYYAWLVAAEWTTECEAILSGKKINDNGWYVGDVTISAPEKCYISLEGLDTSTWYEELPNKVVDEGITTISYYLKNDIGQISGLKTIEIKIDKTAPTVILDGDVKNNVFCQEAKFIVIEENPSLILLDGNNIYNASQEKYMIKGDSKEHCIEVIDQAGNKSLPIYLTINENHTKGDVLIENEFKATCAEKGSFDEVIYCKVCKEEVSREKHIILPTGHNYRKKIINVATCTKDGENVFECEKCNDFYIKKVEATGHKVGETVIENRIEPQIGMEGLYDEVIYCTMCNTEMSRVGKTIPMIEEETPDTGDKSLIFIYVIVTMCGMGLILFAIKLKNNKY